MEEELCLLCTLNGSLNLDTPPPPAHNSVTYETLAECKSPLRDEGKSPYLKGFLCCCCHVVWCRSSQRVEMFESRIQTVWLWLHSSKGHSRKETRVMGEGTGKLESSCTASVNSKQHSLPVRHRHSTRSVQIRQSLIKRVRSEEQAHLGFILTQLVTVSSPLAGLLHHNLSL